MSYPEDERRAPQGIAGDPQAAGEVRIAIGTRAR